MLSSPPSHLRSLLMRTSPSSLRHAAARPWRTSLVSQHVPCFFVSLGIGGVATVAFFASSANGATEKWWGTLEVVLLSATVYAWLAHRSMLRQPGLALRQPAVVAGSPPRGCDDSRARLLSHLHRTTAARPKQPQHALANSNVSRYKRKPRTACR